MRNAGRERAEWGPPFLPDGGPSAYYVSANRGKRSLALDLGKPGAIPVLEDLIRRADILVENFLPDAAIKFGLTPARLVELNPLLVSCAAARRTSGARSSRRPAYHMPRCLLWMTR